MIVITNAKSNESKNLPLNRADRCHHVHHYKYHNQQHFEARKGHLKGANYAL